MKILIIRFSSLGDIVLTTSMVAWLKSKYPNAEVHYVTSKEFGALVENHPYITKTYLFDRKKEGAGFFGLWRYSRKLRREKYDLIIDLHGTIRATCLRFFCFFTPFLTIPKRRWERFLLIKFKKNTLDGEPHLKKILRDFGKIIGFDGNFKKLQGFIQETAIDCKPFLSTTPWTFEEVAKSEEKIIILAPIASFEPKRWPISYFAKLVELIMNDEEFKDVKVVSLAGPSDTYCEPLDEVATKYPRFLNLQGKTNLRETALWIKKAKLCLGNDTGLGHVAESYGIPSYVLFGPTVKEFGFGPHLKESLIIEEDVSCRPCSATGGKPCYREERFCMLNITPERVFKTIKDNWKDLC